MTLIEKLNLLWKFLFLAVFAYGVFSLTCCASQSSCSSQSSCGIDQTQEKQCAAGCMKDCCKPPKP